MKRDYRLTEEFARWAFEIECKKTAGWYIAFTNPTAGPWKAISGINRDGIEGRFYTFDSKENRPDIVLVNDHLKLVMIFEAKSKISDLIKDAQCKKSTKVVADIGKQLQKTRSNEFWGRRYLYSIVLGLLWGNDTSISSEKYDALFNAYYDEISAYDNIDKRAIVGIEVTKKDGKLECTMMGKNYEQGQQTLKISELAESFNLAYKE